MVVVFVALPNKLNFFYYQGVLAINREIFERMKSSGEYRDDSEIFEELLGTRFTKFYDISLPQEYPLLFANNF